MAADPVINELMAVNNHTLSDSDGDFSDWIEIHNPDNSPLNLGGWYLTDDAGAKTKWQFPATTVAPDGYLVVFASDKDRRVAGQQLHTNFKLTGDGEYLGLVKPDGVTVASEYAPSFPAQEPDVSYGLLPPAPTVTTLVAGSGPVKALVPPSNGIGDDWKSPQFDDSSWISGPAGVGYETTGAGVPALPNESEPNNDAASANDASTNWAIRPESSRYQLDVKGNISSSQESDYFRVGELQAGDVVTIGVSGSASARGTLSDPQFFLYRQGNSSTPIRVEANDDGGPGLDALIQRYEVTTTDTYFIQVSGVSFGTGSYELSMTLENAGTPPTTTGSVFAESEPNNSFTAADDVSASWRQVQYESTTAGVVGAADADWYRFDLTAGDFVTFNVDSTSALDGRVSLYRSGGAKPIAVDDGTSTAEAAYDLDASVNAYRITSTGTYLVKVEGAAGTIGGYELQASLSSATAPAGASYFRGLINTNIGAAMQGVSATAYVRSSFDFAGLAASPVETLTLRMKYDDGFVAYLNGVEVARRNAPDGDPAADAAAVAEHPNAQAAAYETIDLSAFKNLLVAGQNVLAIHGLNVSAADDDFLVLPELVAVSPATLQPPVFFATPTPGAANAAVSLNAGPEIGNVSQAPQAPSDADDIVVTAHITPRASNIGSVTLLYRVMFDAETPVTMLDDGAHGDGAAGDGIYGAAIPASASSPGQMVRYAVVATDAEGKVSRAPLHASVNSAQYFGTVIREPSLEVGSLPVFQFFTDDLGSATSRNGARASVYYNGQFYDNVFVRDRGGNTTDGLKFDFNPGDHFRWTNDPNAPRVDEINVNYRSGDETYLRAPLSFEIFRAAGVPALTSFPMRVQANDAFFSVADFVENVDAEHLQRVGLDPNGALYKLVQDRPQLNPSDADAFEKKTRQFEGNSDLRAFLTGLHRTGQTQTNFLFDNFDVFGFISYWAANTIVNDTDDAQKNYYLYRDTEGDGRWRFLPWDKDLTFGKNFGIADYQARDPQTHPFYGDSNHPKIDGPSAWNFLIDALLDNRTIKQMYLRRLRTVMDQVLQPASTPTADRLLEQRIDTLVAQLRSDPVVASALPGLTQQISDIKTRYLNVRRKHLYVDHAASTPTSYPDRAGIPDAQPATFSIKIGDIDFNPVSGDQGQEYIQLTNPNAFAADISGWRLSGAVDYTFPGGAVIPANGSLYVAANVADFRSRTVGPRGGQGLLVIGGYDGQLSARGETIVLNDPAGQTVDSLTYRGNPTPAQLGLRITEIMYHPSGVGGDLPDDQFEFIEVQNVLDQPLDLTGVKFTQGVDFTFGALTLGPGEYAVVVKDRAAFESRYGVGTIRIAGEYAPKSLDDDGERIRLEDAVGEVVLDFSYSDQWQPSTDGGGRSLVIINPAAPVGTWGDAASWQASAAANGSPGAMDGSSAALVVGRRVFYNASFYDGGNAAADASDDAAIATGKHALLAGQTPSFQNVSSYAKGINGVMLDVLGLSDASNLTVDDFTFRIGSGGQPAGWVDAPAPLSVTVRKGAGAGGSDRVTLVWAEGAILNQWLEVTLKATARSGLASADVFSFGNLVGETGDAASLVVTAADLVRVRNAIGSAAGIDNPFDFDRDGAVNAADLVRVRNRVGGALPPPPSALFSLRPIVDRNRNDEPLI